MTASRSTNYYPLFLDVANRDVVIAGGGAVSARKAATMQAHGARVTVVAPEVSPEIEALGVAIRRKTYDAADLENATIVFAATNDAAVNEQIARDCRERRILVNVADAPQRGDFIVPAVIEEGSVAIAVSTGGNSPALARKLKAELRDYAEVSDILGSLRESAKATLPRDEDRKRFFDSIIGAGVVELLRAGKRAEAYEAVAKVCGEAGVPVGANVQQELTRRT